MTSYDPEIRGELRKIRSSEKDARIPAATFDEGRFAFVSGVSVTLAGFAIQIFHVPLTRRLIGTAEG